MEKFIFPVTLALLLAAGCSKQVSPEEKDIPISLDVRLEGSTKATHEDAGTIKDLDFIVRNKTDANYSFSSTRFYPDGGKWVSNIQRLWQGSQIAICSPCHLPFLQGSSASRMKILLPFSVGRWKAYRPRAAMLLIFCTLGKVTALPISAMARQLDLA